MHTGSGEGRHAVDLVLIDESVGTGRPSFGVFVEVLEVAQVLIEESIRPLGQRGGGAVVDGDGLCPRGAR